MEQDEGFVLIEARDRVTGGQRETQRAADWHAESFDERKVALDGVGVAIDLRGVLVKEARSLRARRSFRRIRADDSSCPMSARCAGGPGNRARHRAGGARSRATTGSKCVDMPKPPRLPRGKMWAWSTLFVAPQERGPFGVDDPGDFGLRVGVTEERGGGQECAQCRRENSV